MDLSEWDKIPNFGIDNCGIFIHKKNPDILLKCENRSAPSEQYQNAKKLQDAGHHLFPRIIDMKIVDGKQYTTMERFDGDLTQFFTEQIPNDILNDKANGYTEEQKKEIKELIALKLHKIVSPSITAFTITKNIFDVFMQKLFSVYYNVYENILYRLANLNIRLFYIGYSWNDPKFDNYGYKLNSMDIYFLDWDSGLSKLDDAAYSKIDLFIKELNEGMNMTVFGKITFSHMFSHSRIVSEIINPDIQSILNQPYIFNVPTYEFETINDVESFLKWTPRLLSFLSERGYIIENPIKTEQKRRGAPKIDYVNNKNKTQLMEACEFNEIEKVRHLLERGANPKIDINGESAMSLAIQNYNRIKRDTTEIIQILFRKGIKLPKTIDGDALFAYILRRKSELPWKVNQEFVGINLPFVQFLAEKGMSLPPLLQTTTDKQIEEKLLEIILSTVDDSDLKEYIKSHILSTQIKELIRLIKTKKGGARTRSKQRRKTRRRLRN